jgi:hypothetical protein
MRTILIVAAAIGAFGAAALPAAPAAAQSWRGGYYDHRDYRRSVAWAQRECHRELRRAHSRRAYARAQRQCDRLLARAHRDYRYSARYDRRYYQAPRPGYFWDGRRWRSRW